MRISAVEEYGLRCLLSLARKGTQDRLSITEIAEMEGLSIPYASKLLSLLRKSGLVVAARGRSGGFSIAREPREITMYEVLTSLGGPLMGPNHCAKYKGQLDECVHLDRCSVHDVLGSLTVILEGYLTGTTLKDMLDKSDASVEATPMKFAVTPDNNPDGVVGHLKE